MAENETVAVLGAGGTMGKAMARNMLKAGLGVRAWNRTRDRAEELAGDGAVICDTPAEAAQGATIVLTILTDADTVLDAVDGDDGALAGAGDGTIWIQASTLGLEGIDRCIEVADKAGV